MNYIEARVYLDEVSKYGSVLGLESMRELHFKEKQCDIVTPEVGCGGLLDATNVITTTVLEVIASISMDHTELLGDTLTKIAAQKAGIIRPDNVQ